MSEQNTMLLMLPVPFRIIDSVLHIEYQAHHGLRRWLDSFDRLIVGAAIMPEMIAEQRKEMRWRAVNDLDSHIDFLTLPWAYRIDTFIKELPATAALIARKIEQARYLQFAIGGIVGDWATVGAIIALRKGRKYAIHTDRIEHEILLHVSAEKRFPYRFKAALDSRILMILQKILIRNCDLGLFHGMDTYELYHQWMQESGKQNNAYCIHNIHDEGLEEENDRSSLIDTSATRHTPITLFYAGRMDATKAPLQWLEVVRVLAEKHPGIRAIWAGEGDLRPDFDRKLRDLELEDVVDAPGFIPDRKKVAQLYRDADIFMFTHITPESPRCLLEALKFGIPIIGYESAFAKDLIKKNGGGLVVENGNIHALANLVSEIINEPDRLMILKKNAREDGKAFSSKAVFKERAGLIKKHL